MKNGVAIREKTLLWAILIMVLSIYGACQKDEGIDQDDLWVNAVILDFGSPAVDGCGFVIRIEDQIYYPVNLEEKYQIDGKNVKVQFNILEEMHTCGFPHSGVTFQKVNIRKIRNR